MAKKSPNKVPDWMFPELPDDIEAVFAGLDDDSPTGKGTPIPASAFPEGFVSASVASSTITPATTHDPSATALPKHTYRKRVGPRVPVTAEGLQMNFCKNPQCANFGVIPLDKVDKGRNPKIKDNYNISGPKSDPLTSNLKCMLCGDVIPMKSNRGILDEFNRLMRQFNLETEASCPNEECTNFGKGVESNRGCYQSYGKTPHGSDRFKCKECDKTFSVGKATLRHKKQHKNKDLFLALVNKSPFNRIMEEHDISAKVIYDKIDFLYDQCQRFVASRELHLLHGMPLNRLSVSVDRQEYTLNWSRRSDKRNIVLQAVSSADTASGYIFGMHLNYDNNYNPEDIEADVRKDDDDQRQKQDRRNARFWLKADYAESVVNSGKWKLQTIRRDILDDVEYAYLDAEGRPDPIASERHSKNSRLPERGMQIAVLTDWGTSLKFPMTAENFRTTVWGALAVFSLSAKTYYKRLEKYEDDAKFIKASQDAENKASQAKKDLTVLTIAEWQKQLVTPFDFVQGRLWLEANTGGAVGSVHKGIVGRNGPSDLRSVQMDEEAYLKMHGLMRFYDFIAVGVKHGTFDKGVVLDLLGDEFVYMANNCEFWLLETRLKTYPAFLALAKEFEEDIIVTEQVRATMRKA